MPQPEIMGGRTQIPVFFFFFFFFLNPFLRAPQGTEPHVALPYLQFCPYIINLLIVWLFLSAPDSYGIAIIA